MYALSMSAMDIACARLAIKGYLFSKVEDPVKGVPA